MRLVHVTHHTHFASLRHRYAALACGLLAPSCVTCRPGHRFSALLLQLLLLKRLLSRIAGGHYMKTMSRLLLVALLAVLSLANGFVANNAGELPSLTSSAHIHVHF